MLEAEQILVDLLDNPSFNRWIKGEADKMEQKKWKKWQDEAAMHAEVRKKALKLYDLPLEEMRGDDLQRELKRLLDRMGEGNEFGERSKIDEHSKVGEPSKIDEPKEISERSKIDERNKVFQLPEQSRQNSTGYRWAVAASIVLLTAAISVITLYTLRQPKVSGSEPLYSNVEVGYGEKANLEISDGSRIQVNSNSTLRYAPEQFNRSQVEVWLEGEAHFSIVNHPDGRKRNLIVHTPDGEIRILGTRFNVNTRYERTGVVVEEGSVEVQRNDSLTKVTESVKLGQGQRAQFSSAQPDIQVQQVDTLLYTAWLDGKLEFRETPLKDIVNNIEQIYGVTIEVEDSTLADEKISGSLRNPDLETLLEGVAAVLDVRIVKQNDDLYSMTRK